MSRRALCLAALGVLARPGAAFCLEAEHLAFDTLYASFGVRGYAFSELVKSSAGRAVSIQGYMAPPLKAEAAFFVLTREPLAICPFCQSDADWPADIIVVQLKGASPLVSAGTRVRVTGTLEIGSKIDPDTGFVSQIRIVEASYAKIR
jgi:hypothetical protein